MKATAQSIREGLVDEPFDLPWMVSGAEVPGDDVLVAEPILSRDKVVQVHVTKLLDLLRPMSRRDEREFCDQNIRFVHFRILVESRGRTIAEVGDQGNAPLRSDFRAGSAEITNLFARQRLIFGF